MKLSLFVGLAGLWAHSAVAFDPHEGNKVVCYWNYTSSLNPDPRHVSLDDLRLVLPYCTHLIYSDLGINLTGNKVRLLHPLFPTDQSLHSLPAELKKSFPGLKTYLSFGVNANLRWEARNYFTVIESPEVRSNFVKGVVELISAYGFDGVDLAWPLSEGKSREYLGFIWATIKERYGMVASEEETERRKYFADLVRDLKNDGKMDVTVTVRAHDNVFYDPKLLVENIDAVHLMGFDQRTPERYPTEADYPAPMEGRNGSVAPVDPESALSYWLERGTPRHKIVLGISTFARTWKLTDESGTTGRPPLIADGPGAAGPLTKTPGILSYAEVCSRLARKSVNRVRRVGDPSKMHGTYAFLPYNPKTGTDGIWIGYEDPDTAGSKAVYAKNMGLGGVAIFDLSTDDFHATCSKDIFPIVRTVQFKLRNSQP